MVVFLVVFGLFALGLRWLLHYTSQTVGAASPLSKPVTYAYAHSYFWGRETVWVLPLALLLSCLSWLLMALLPTATQLWHYLLVVSFLALTIFFVYLLNRLFWVESQFVRIIRDTAIHLDPATRSVVVSRAGTDTVLTASTLAAIEFHAVTYGKLHYHYYRFIDQAGHATPIYDYGEGLSIAIDLYFNGVSTAGFAHRYPSAPLPLN